MPAFRELMKTYSFNRVYMWHLYSCFYIEVYVRHLCSVVVCRSLYIFCLFSLHYKLGRLIGHSDCVAIRTTMLLLVWLLKNKLFTMTRAMTVNFFSKEITCPGPESNPVPPNVQARVSRNWRFDSSCHPGVRFSLSGPLYYTRWLVSCGPHERLQSGREGQGGMRQASN